MSPRSRAERIDSGRWRQTVIDGAAFLGLKVSRDQAAAMERHARELLQWNQVTNLTAITEPLEVAVKHYIDALAAAPWINEGARLLDAGTGGGFPGIPLKILRPDLTITLVDSVRKKVSFLKHAIRTLGLDGIDAVHGRLEELGASSPYHGSFDVVICRAFASLEKFVTLARPFLIPGGRLLAMKGRDPDLPAERTDAAETRVIAGTRCSFQHHRYRLPFLNAQRSLIILTV